MIRFVLLVALVSCGQRTVEKPQIEPKPQEKPLPIPNPNPKPEPQPMPPPAPLPEPNPLPNPIPIPPQDSADNAIIKELLDYHNTKRCAHNAPSLTWSDTLAAQATGHAKNCVFAHDASANAGENLAIGFPTNIAAMSAWYDEVKDYDFSRGTFSPATGHFTQMVWQNSSELGCGIAECRQGSYLVCRYLPAGNVLGRFTLNVFPISDNCQ